MEQNTKESELDFNQLLKMEAVKTFAAYAGATAGLMIGLGTVGLIAEARKESKKIRDARLQKKYDKEFEGIINNNKKPKK